MDTGFKPSALMAGYLKQTDPDQAVKLARELCSQLEDDPDSFHGGVWPGNIDIDAEGKAVLGPVDHTEPSRRPADQVEYLAPEYFWDNERSAAADVYSIGLMLYAGCSGGALPFLDGAGEPTAKDRSAALRRRMKGETVTAPEGVSDELKKVMERALAYEPERRYITAREFLTALGRTDEALPAANAAAAAAVLAAGLDPLPEEAAEEPAVPETVPEDEAAPAAPDAESEVLAAESAPEAGQDQEPAAEEVQPSDQAEPGAESETPAAEEPATEADAAPEADEPTPETDEPVPEEPAAAEEIAPETEAPAPEDTPAAEKAKEDAPAADAGRESRTAAAAAPAKSAKKSGRSKRGAKGKTPADSGRIARVPDRNASRSAAGRSGANKAAGDARQTQYRVQKDFEGSPRMRNVRNTGPNQKKKKRSAVIPVLCGIAAAILMGSIGYMTYGFLAKSPELSQPYTGASDTQEPPPAMTDVPEPTATPLPTQTPRPTHTPRPTADPNGTPEPQATPGADTAAAAITPDPGDGTFKVDAASGTLYVNLAIGTNVRSGPGTSYSVLGTLKQNTAVTRTGTVDDEWTQVIYNGATGYIFSQNLSSAKPTGSSRNTTYQSSVNSAASVGKTLFAPTMDAKEQEDMMSALRQLSSNYPNLKYVWLGARYDGEKWLTLRDGEVDLSAFTEQSSPAPTANSRLYLIRNSAGEWKYYAVSTDGTIAGAVDGQVGYLTYDK